MHQLTNKKPRCPECRSKNSVALPSQAFKISSGSVMVYRCRNCGGTFNDLSGISEASESEKEKKKEEDEEAKKSPLEGLSEPERIDKIRKILERSK